LPFAEKDPNLCSHVLFPLTVVFYLLAELPVIGSIFFFSKGAITRSKFGAFRYTFSI